MNFLAHVYLSGDDHRLLIGNFIADMLRGKEIYNYESQILKGIQLHRAIDKYTDAHPIVKSCIEIIKDKQGRYASVIVDIAFDHFLGKNWERYHRQSLDTFTQDTYQIMELNKSILPDKFLRILPKMKSQDWLFQYQFIEGITKAFQGIAKRAAFDSNMARAADDLLDHYDILEDNFESFFLDLCNFVESQGVVLETPKRRI